MSFDNILKEFGMKDEADLARRLEDDPDLSPSEFVAAVKVEINGLIIENNDLEKEIDEIQSYLLPPGAFPNTDAFIVKLRELKEEIKGIPDLLEEERYKERACNERDWEDKEEEIVEDLTAEIEELQEQNQELKRGNEELQGQNQELKGEAACQDFLGAAARHAVAKGREEIERLTAQFEHEKKTGANSVLAHGDIEEWCLTVEAENKKLKEENEKLKTVEKIIGENWGGHFREAFEMIGVEEDLIESGFSTPEDFE